MRLQAALQGSVRFADGATEMQVWRREAYAKFVQEHLSARQSLFAVSQNCRQVCDRIVSSQQHASKLPSKTSSLSVTRACSA